MIGLAYSTLGRKSHFITPSPVGNRVRSILIKAQARIGIEDADVLRRAVRPRSQASHPMISTY